MRDRHGSPFEHNSMTFYVQAPIFVFREFMRHRIASYNEESGRYRELRPVFYVPGRDRDLVQVGKPGAYEFLPGDDEQHELVDRLTRERSLAAYEAYRSMLDAGVAREVARIVLPLNLYSSMYVTLNARSLMNFLSLRTKHPASTSRPSRSGRSSLRGGHGGALGRPSCRTPTRPSQRTAASPRSPARRQAARRREAPRSPAC